MVQAKIGDKVKVHFTGYLDDGTVFGSTQDDDPFEFTIGEKNMLPGFENSVVGMQEGDINTITLPPEEAYGPHKKELVHGMDRSGFPEEINLEVKKQLRVRTQDG
ncbi:MAG: FKBP-type peptidyl-prolyl cis-trans isomerase, partial [Deltaproteobacteria bacterium]|nr:FKBP-type peptidyl-prolyl cis-trans isomerase [Deltaproteobacteria bacterium]